MIKPFNKTKTGHNTSESGYIQLLLSRDLEPLPVFKVEMKGPRSEQGTYQTLPHRGDYKIVRRYDNIANAEQLIVYQFKQTKDGLRPVTIIDGKLKQHIRENFRWFLSMDIKTPGPIFLPEDKVKRIPFNQEIMLNESRPTDFDSSRSLLRKNVPTPPKPKTFEEAFTEIFLTAN